MKISFLTLTLQCRESREVVEFSPQITYIHGQISAGKSSIMRLIDYCFGGELELTPAISQELVSVELSCQIGKYDVLFERQKKTNQVQVSWKNDDGESGSVLAPLTAGSKAIWGEDVYNVSDLVFSLAELKPIKVRKSKHDENSELVRLSFRDLMWYCYLDQDHLDSSFYRLEDPFRGLKSRDVMRFVTGAYTDQMNESEIALDSIQREYLAKFEAVKLIRSFLEEFGYALESDVAKEIAQNEAELCEALQEQTSLEQQKKANTHFADELREELREQSSLISREELALDDLKERIAEQEALKAELFTAKFKLARSESASSIFSRVAFEVCPACGTDVKNDHFHLPENCQLCGRPSVEHADTASAEMVRQDLTSRIEDLTESLDRHKRAYKRQERLVGELRQEKAALDERLNEELFKYDSAYLSQSREVEQRIATLQERRRGLDRTAKLPEAITKLEEEADRLKGEEERLKREIENEKKKLTEAEQRIREIEDAYLDALRQVGVPGISDKDRIEIRRNTWMPWIIPEEGDAYNFFNAGSGGKKTLLNVCYALAVHRVAAEHGLPLPTFLMIDTPMKNIGEDVNRNIFENFYKYLYELAGGPLANTQFIIIDKEYFPLEPGSELDVLERYMEPKQPLISYYQGP